MKRFLNTQSRTWEASDAARARHINRQKAQSGAFADALMSAVTTDASMPDPSLTPAETRQWFRAREREARRSARQTECAKSFNYRVVEHEDGSSEGMTLFSRRCNRPTCVLCNDINSARLHKRLVEACDIALDAVPGRRALHLTLTLPLTPFDGLGPALDTLHSATRKLFLTKPFRAAFAGSYRRSEVKFNPVARTWHPHAHCLMITDPDYFDFDGPLYLAHARIQELWVRALGLPPESFVSVSIRAVADRVTGANDPAAVRRNLLELCKYTTEPASLYSELDPENGTYSIAPDVAAALSRGLHGKRMIAFHGCLTPKSLRQAKAKLSTELADAAPDDTGSRANGSRPPPREGHRNPSTME